MTCYKTSFLYKARVCCKAIIWKCLFGKASVNGSCFSAFEGVSYESGAIGLVIGCQCEDAVGKRGFSVFCLVARYTGDTTKRQFENLLSVNKTRHLACRLRRVFAYAFAYRAFSDGGFRLWKGFSYVRTEN